MCRINGDAAHVCGVIFGHDSPFILGLFDVEINDALSFMAAMYAFSLFRRRCAAFTLKVFPEHVAVGAGCAAVLSSFRIFVEPLRF